MLLYQVSISRHLDENGKEQLQTEIYGDPNLLQCLGLLSFGEHVVNRYFIELK